jgi:hypothetical protein
MRKRLLFLTVLILSISQGYTQSFKNNSYLDFTIGPSFPIGAYGQKDVSNNSSGVAKTGEFLKISYVHLLNKNFGLSVGIHAQRNPLDTKAFETSMSNQTFHEGVILTSTSSPTPTPTQFPSYKYGNWKFDKNAWLFGSLSVGGYAQVSPKQSKNLVITAKAMVGAIYATSPTISGKSTSDTAMAQIKQSSASAFGLTYSVLGGLKFKLTNKIHLLTQVEYLGTSELLFKHIHTSFTTIHYVNGTPGSWSNGKSLESGKQRIASINVNFGISVNL